ncbi:TVP38/TMEM64 family protein [Paenibacillus sp. NPDC056579]|uniref:TVP38/TMEM64 family protein n=1 Tax=unclassified Paenibacillus TaxID=185978 RepID=UPI001EF7CE0A|nr:TVP38/TMEM64 family protein [Paenibacillus sp. H1-7]ULL17442.1 TVP38/TMEM64 family protein [Paenibacillus sp. H1-7]
MAEWNVRHLSELLQSWGIWGHLAGGLLAFLQTVFPIVPFVVIAGANVLIFGLWAGFVVNYAMAVLGSICLFWVARHYAGGWVEKKLEQYAYIKKFNSKLEQNGFLYIAISRVIPVLPSFGISLAAAVMKVRTRDFVLGTVVGKLPMILLESMLGHDLLYFHQYKRRLLLLVLIFVILLIIGNIYKKKWFDNGNNKVS